MSIEKKNKIFNVNQDINVYIEFEYYKKEIMSRKEIDFCSIGNSIDKLEEVINHLLDIYYDLYRFNKYTILFYHENENISNKPKKMKLKLDVKLCSSKKFIPKGYILINSSSFENDKAFIDFNNDLIKEEEEKPLQNKNEEYKILKYKINFGEGDLKIFGKKFIKNNRNNCQIILNDEIKINLCEYLFYEGSDKTLLEIKLGIINNITDMSYMFSECSSLPFISNFDISKVEDISDLFSGCSSIEFIPDISKWETSEIKYMNNLFSNCLSLKSLPDISNWDTSKVIGMNNMFFNCKSLKSLPDISKWNISELKELKNMFSGCSSLESLPDISKWNTLNIKKMTNLFSGCSSLKKLPSFSDEIILKYKIDKNSKIKLFGKQFTLNNKDNCQIIYNLKEFELQESLELDNNIKDFLEIKLRGINNITNTRFMFSDCSSLLSISNISNWNTSIITNMSYMFSDCTLLKSLPDISKFDTSNVTDMSFIFSGCKSLLSLPDISKWNISKLHNISNMFSDCSSLETLPDISNWNTSKIRNMSYLFKKCSSLKSLPDISVWNTSNVIYFNYMFCGCSSLSDLPDISKWDTSKVIKMSYMFSDCSSLKSLPDISK